LAIEDGRGFGLFRRNYREIYGYGLLKIIEGLLPA